MQAAQATRSSCSRHDGGRTPADRSHHGNAFEAAGSAETAFDVHDAGHETSANKTFN
jgi:hypothetical protein